jgi:hypothetical protein
MLLNGEAATFIMRDMKELQNLQGSQKGFFDVCRAARLSQECRLFTKLSDGGSVADRNFLHYILSMTNDPSTAGSWDKFTRGECLLNRTAAQSDEKGDGIRRHRPQEPIVVHAPDVLIRMTIGYRQSGQ